MSDPKQRRRIDQIRDPAFIDDLRDISLDELRQRRAMCDSVDTELSYYRRLLHGRMDLLAFELRRRSGEETRTLIEALPEILAGAEAASPLTTTGRAVSVALPDIPGNGQRTIDQVLGDDFLARLPSLDDAELRDIQALLAEVESEISEQRRAVYEVFEGLQSELTRRYREGLADVSELLDRG